MECAFSRSQGVELESERTLPTKHTEKGGGKERDGWPAMVVGKTLQSVVKLTGWVFFFLFIFLVLLLTIDRSEQASFAHLGSLEG